MSQVAMLGTGMMGSGMVEAMRRRGVEVVVWNRTREKAEPLAKLGARVAGTAAEAVRGAARVHLSLGDDASVDGVLASIAPALERGVIVVDHTTVTPRGTRERYARCDAEGVQYLHAPVFMSPQACKDAGGVMLASGPAARFDAVKAELEKMTGHLWYVGERVDKAAVLKLCGNEILMFIVAGLADVYALARDAGLEPVEAHELFAHWKPGVAIDLRGAAMARGNFTSAFDLAMARKDVRLMLETAAEGSFPLHLLPSIAKRMDELIERGHGGEDVGVLAIESARAGAGRV